jgi:radical SAM protein with 4Fe4S-binding SPASM domain
VIRVKSNGVPLNQRNVERLKAEVDPFMIDISLHGARPETHDRLTQVPGSFERLLKNIELMKEAGLRVKLNSTLTTWNEEEVEAMFGLADRFGLPLEFDPEVTPRDNGDLSPLEIAPGRQGIENMMRISLQRSVGKLSSDRLALKLRPPNQPALKPDPGKHKVCGAGSTNLVVDPFGNVYPCVQFRRKVGNVHADSIRHIWASSGELHRVRELAGRALEVSLENGLKQFCMGVNEMRTGDPLKAPQSMLENDRTFQRVDWEVLAHNQDVA